MVTDDEPVTPTHILYIKPYEILNGQARATPFLFKSLGVDDWPGSYPLSPFVAIAFRSLF